MPRLRSCLDTWLSRFPAPGCWALAVLAVLAVGPARAQDASNAPPSGKRAKPPPVGMEVQAGVKVGDDFFIRPDPTRGVPVRVVLDNNGDPVSGRIELRDARGRTTETPFDLPRNAHKEYTLVVRAPAQEEENSSSTSLEASVMAGNRALNRQKVTVKLLAGSTLLLCPATEGGGLEFLNDRQAYNVGADEKKTLVSSVAVQDLPRQWAGYEPADIVVLNGSTWRAMDDDQRRALRIWLEQGGRAVLCGEQTTEWRDPEAQAVAGVEPTDLRSVSRLDCVAAWAGTPYRAESGKLLTVSGPLNAGAWVALQQDGRPLAVRRAVLRGQVLWLGFDPFRQTVRDWPGSRRFWAAALANLKVNTEEVLHPVEGVEDARAAANALPRLPAPPMSAIVVFGVIYALIFGPLNIWVLRRMRRTVRSWLFMPSLALGMTLIVLVAGQSWGSGRTVLNSLSILQASSGGRTAYEQNLTGIFSPTNRSFDLTLDDPAPRLLDQSGVEAGEAGGNLEWPGHQSDAGVRWDAVALSLFSTRVLEQWRPRDLNGSVRITLDGAGVGSVRNDTGLMLRGAYLCRGRKYCWLGDLQPRAAQAVRPDRWREKLTGELPRPTNAGQLLENEKFRGSVGKLWSGAPEQLLTDAARKDAWLVAEVDGYHGGLQVQDVPYNNRAALLLVRMAR